MTAEEIGAQLRAMLDRLPRRQAPLNVRAADLEGATDDDRAEARKDARERWSATDEARLSDRRAG